MTPPKTPPPPTRMVNTELLFLQRIVTPPGAIPHRSGHRPGEQLKLLVPHEYILPHPTQHPLITNHANLNNYPSRNNQLRGQRQKQFPSEDQSNSHDAVSAWLDDGALIRRPSPGEHGFGDLEGAPVIV
jgi:hypothetical protein